MTWITAVHLHHLMIQWAEKTLHISADLFIAGCGAMVFAGLLWGGAHILPSDLPMNDLPHH